MLVLTGCVRRLQPTQAEIARLTRDLPPCPESQTGVSEVASGLDIQAQFRIVLTKLADKGRQLQQALAGEAAQSSEQGCWLAHTARAARLLSLTVVAGYQGKEPRVTPSTP